MRFERLQILDVNRRPYRRCSRLLRDAECMKNDTARNRPHFHYEENNEENERITKRINEWSRTSTQLNKQIQWLT